MCRWAAAFFALVGALVVAGPIVPLAMTGNPLAELRCKIPKPCSGLDGSLQHLDESVREQVADTPGAGDRYKSHVARAPVRIGLSALVIIDGMPFATLLLGVAMALRQFGSSRNDGSKLDRALSWLRIGALGAIAAALWPVIGGVAKSAMLLPGTPYGPGVIVDVDFNSLVFHLLLATAMFAVVWALEEGLKAQRDLAEIV